MASSGLEIAQAYEERAGWKPIKPSQCALCGQEPARKVDEDWWLEELELLAEATLL